MKKKSTLFLRIVLFCLGIPVIVLAGAALIAVIQHPFNDTYGPILYPMMIGMLLSLIPYYIALFKTWKLLNFIDQGTSFSQGSVQILRTIKKCGFAVAAIYFVLLPFFYQLAQITDAPGIMVIGGLPCFGGVVIALFAAVLEKLLHEAIYYKDESELTI